MSFREFSEDQLTIDAVLRNFSVIGEASRHLSLAIIWETVQHDLPPLAPLLRRILEEAAKNG